MLNIPAGAQSIKQNYRITITDTNGSTKSFPIVVNVKVPPKANLSIGHDNFHHACEDADKNGTGQYRINGQAAQFTITRKRNWKR